MTPGIRKHKSASCRVELPRGEMAHLDNLREIVAVESGFKGNGHAAGLLDSVCAEADGMSYVLMLMVKPFGEGMDESRLEDFYAKRGFVVAQRDPETVMIRPPRTLH